MVHQSDQPPAIHVVPPIWVPRGRERELELPVAVRPPRAGRICDNGAYVRLLWSGKSKSAVTISESCASFRAIVAAIGGYDEVVEASTLVWEPDGKTFDVASAFVVGTNDWRSLRMRLTVSGKNLSIDYNLGQTARDAVDNAYLLYVVGIV